MDSCSTFSPSHGASSVSQWICVYAGRYTHTYLKHSIHLYIDVCIVLIGYVPPLIIFVLYNWHCMISVRLI